MNSELIFDTNWAEFHLFVEDGVIYERHCGYGKGCFWTSPVAIGDASEELKQIKKEYIAFYGEYSE